MATTIGQGKDEYVFVNRENASDKVIVKQDDDPNLNDSLNEIEAEARLNNANDSFRGRYTFESKKLGAVPKEMQADERADVKIGQVS